MTGFFSIGSTWPVIIRPYTYSQSFPSWTPRTPQRPTWPSPILQYRAHAVHTILFVPSTGFHSSPTFPVACPGGSRTSSGAIRSAFVAIDSDSTEGRLKHLSGPILQMRGPEVLPPSVLQGDGASLLRVQPVPAAGLHLPDHRELVPLLEPLRLSVPLEQVRETVRAHGREELEVPAVVQCEVLDRPPVRVLQPPVHRDCVVVDHERHLARDGDLVDRRPETVGDVHAARHRIALREEDPLLDPGPRPHQEFERLRAPLRILESLGGPARASQVPGDDDDIPGDLGRAGWAAQA